MRTIEWRGGKVCTLDQTRLPHETVILEIDSCASMAEAIRNMRVRGAPLLGAAAAFGMALTAQTSQAKTVEALFAELEASASMLKQTRPTAVNLFWAVDRVMQKAKAAKADVDELRRIVVQEAQRIAEEDASANRQLGRKGAELLSDGDVVLTHCNAGELATVEYGTALGVIRAAVESGKKIRVVATETRPLLQGARLTAYELVRDGIPVTLITDNMVGYVMYKRLVNKVIVGADRIVRDAVINKVGTFTVAVVAKAHNVPFYVAAPQSTFDLKRTSNQVVIEERKPEEVTHLNGRRIAAEGVNVLNPAFDITPLEYVSAIISDAGIMRREDFKNLAAAT